MRRVDVEAVVQARVVEVVAEAGDHHGVELEVAELDRGPSERALPRVRRGRRVSEELALGEAEEGLGDVDGVAEVVVGVAVAAHEQLDAADEGVELRLGRVG